MLTVTHNSATFQKNGPNLAGSLPRWRRKNPLPPCITANPPIQKPIIAIAQPKKVTKAVCDAFLARVNPVASIARPAGMKKTKEPVKNCQSTTGFSTVGGPMAISMAWAVDPGRTLESVTARAKMPNALNAWPFSRIPFHDYFRSPLEQIGYAHAQRELVAVAIVGARLV